MKHECMTLGGWCLCRATVPQAFEATFAEGIAQVDSRAWDRLVQNASLFMQRRVLAAMEQTLPVGMRHGYVILRRDGRPVLAAAFQHFQVSDEQLELGAAEAESALEAMVRRVRKALLGALGRNVLVCGDLFTCGPHGWAFAPEIAEDERWPLLAHAVQVLHRRTGWRGDFLVIKDLPEDDGTARTGLGATGFFRVPTEPTMVFDCDPAWHDIDDYLAALKAKYRKAARLVFQQLDAAGMERVHPVDLDALSPALNQLYAQVERRADVRFGVLAADHLPRLAEALGPDQFRCTVIQRAGTPLGFSSTLRDGETAIAHIVGFDYAANAEAPVYLGLLYSIIVDAMTLGCTRIVFGRTALEPKARLGARPEAMRAYVRHRNPALNGIARLLLNFVPQHQPPARHPFARESE